MWTMGLSFSGMSFDKDGCYQPLPDARAKTLQNQVQRTFKQGVSQVKSTGKRVTAQGKNIASQSRETFEETKECLK